MYRRAIWWVLGCLLTACATPVPPTSTPTPTHTPAAKVNEWSGRLSLQVQTQPPQQLNASFALQGGATQGQLDVLSPLGTTLASLQWSPQNVVLRQGDQAKRFESLSQMTERLTGAQLPMDALFDWLQGVPTPVPGWQADLSQREVGWLLATRQAPAPTVTLKIKLD